MDLEMQQIYPLTPMQLGMLYHFLMDRKSNAYFEQNVFSIQGSIDIGVFEECFKNLVKRYDVLRTVFVYEGLEEPVQVVLKERETGIYFKDISHLGENEKRVFLDNFKTRDKNKGFDLQKDMLIRFALFKVLKKSYILVWSFHHILMDGWCLGVLLRDFIQIYNFLKRNESVDLPPSKPYRRYIEWLERQDKEEGLRYWKKYLEGYKKPSTLQVFENDKKNNRYKLEEYAVIIDEKLSKGLEAITMEINVTANIIFQTIWGILLQKFNNTDDVVFGVVVSGRPPEIEDVENIVGLFINTIPVRIEVTDDIINFAQLLRKVQHQSILSKSYEFLLLAEIQANSSLKRDLIDHIIAFENYPIRGQEKGISIRQEIEFRVRNMQAYEQSNYNLNIIIAPGRSKFMVKFNYNSYVYETNLIKKIARHFREVVKVVVDNIYIEIESIKSSYDLLDAELNILTSEYTDFNF